METKNKDLINEFKQLKDNHRDTTINEDERFDMYEKGIMSLYNKRYEMFKQQNGRLNPTDFAEAATEFNEKFAQEFEAEFTAMEPINERRQQETEQALNLRNEQIEMNAGVPPTGTEAVLGTQDPSTIFQPTEPAPMGAPQQPEKQTPPLPEAMGSMGA